MLRHVGLDGAAGLTVEGRSTAGLPIAGEANLVLRERRSGEERRAPLRATPDGGFAGSLDLGPPWPQGAPGARLGPADPRCRARTGPAWRGLRIDEETPLPPPAVVERDGERLPAALPAHGPRQPRRWPCSTCPGARRSTACGSAERTRAASPGRCPTAR